MPPDYLSKILARLRGRGLVTSQKGWGGGFRMKGTAGAVTMAAVLETFDGKREKDACAFGLGRCDADDPCPLHPHWERVRGSLETCALEIDGGLALDRAVAREYAGFLRGFADAWHHGKEEDILFRRMVERGFSAESGPVAVMLLEHAQGRALVGAIHGVGEGEGKPGPAERAAFLSGARGFVPLLRQHIQKEDNFLYRMSERVLAPAEFETMLADFQAFERKAGADGTRDRLEALAERLAGSFRPDEARMAAGSAGGCWSRG